jgi:hypothetical protein
MAYTGLACPVRSTAFTPSALGLLGGQACPVTGLRITQKLLLCLTVF